jgi:hypothetical protein
MNTQELFEMNSNRNIRNKMKSACNNQADAISNKNTDITDLSKFYLTFRS